MTLAEEAQRYLAVVEFFRAQGAEPHWRPEGAVTTQSIGSTASSSIPKTSEGSKTCPD